MMLWNQLRENMLTYADEKKEKARGTRFQLKESMLHQKDQKYTNWKIVNVAMTFGGVFTVQDLGPLTCRGRSKEMANITMEDNRVIDIIKLVGLEGLFRAPSKGIDHCLITALVERWRPETHTFHLPHGEMSITLEDVEVILGLPIDGEVLIGPTAVEGGDWKQLCVELLGFEVPANDNTTLVGQRILISRLV
ncbi:hypothetical protein SO802_027938 [Lithocarpus litseifolius]|uniref:Aminotransferase-like plant mobile domain-containing protein n=1 Tax=Lithocarpus litseifolius TaxID=425828 RepID=A0AAW2BNX8_9ROSI